MFKNVATKIALFAFDTTTGLGKTGDAANITAYVSKDFGTVTVLADTSATEMEATNARGWYLFDVAQGETNADSLLFTGKSSTANISIVGRPIETTPNRFTSMVIDAAGLVDGTTVKVGPSGSATAQTAGDIMADTNDIQARLPAALVGGRMDSSVGAMAANVLTATAIAADAITDAKVAADVTIASVTGAVGSVTGNVGGNVTGSVGSVAAGGITASSIAADAIGASELAADAAAEIAAAVRTELTTELGRVDVAVSTRLATVGYTAPLDAAGTRSAVGLASANLDTQLGAIKTDTAAIKLKTDNLPTDPADASDIAGAFSTVNGTLSTIAGYIDTEVAAIKVVTDKVDTTLQATSDGYAFTANALENAPTGGTTPPTAAAIAQEVWERVLDGTYSAEELMRVFAAFAAGKSSGFETLNPVFRNLADSKNVIVGETDTFGNRTTVTIDAT